MRSTRVILAAGGSGGHIFPSVALFEKLKERGIEDVFFVSSRRKLDMNILNDKDYSCFHLSINPMPRGFHPVKILTFIFNFFGDIVRSILIVKKLRPDIVVGFGGYSSGAIVAAAHLFKVPVLLHEQNYKPGRANKILGHIADCIATSFEDSRIFFTDIRGEIVCTGNPLRAEMLKGERVKALDVLGLKDDLPTILIMGGSQGSSFLNRTATRTAFELSKSFPSGIQYIHLTGEKDYQEVKLYYEEKNIIALVYSFLDNMELAYAATDIVVSRSGAAAIFELAHYGKAMILVPYPNPKNNQRTNAEYFEKKGGAIYKNENKLTDKELAEVISGILKDDNKKRSLEKAARSLSRSDAAEKLAEKVIEIAEEKKRVK